MSLSVGARAAGTLDIVCFSSMVSLGYFEFLV
jgi:hypothetical protein